MLYKREENNVKYSSGFALKYIIPDQQRVFGPANLSIV